MDKLLLTTAYHANYYYEHISSHFIGLTDYSNQYLMWSYSEEAELIQSIVKKVLAKIKTTPVGLAEYTVGLDSRVEKITNLLDSKSNGVKVLGLHGIGGVGKTTLATALFNKLLPRFQLRSFIPNIRSETSSSDDQSGLLSLQNKLITDLSQGNKDPPVSEINAGKDGANEGPEGLSHPSAFRFLFYFFYFI